MFDWSEIDSGEVVAYRCKIYDCFTLSIYQSGDGTWEGAFKVGEQVVRRKIGLADADKAKEAMAQAYISFIEKCVNDIGIGFIKRKKILIIDDEQALLKLTSRFLSRQGYETLTAANGEQGLELIRNNEIDLIFTDLKMPIMDGEAFLKTLKSRYASDIPVVVITGHGTVEKAVELMKLGVRDFLLKPVDLDQLKEITQNALMEF